MIVLGLHVLARLLFMDDDAQFARARALLEQAVGYTAPVSVVPELVWPLPVNGCERQEIARALRLLIGLPNFTPHALTSLAYALQWCEAGTDFAEALHLAQCGQEQALATFDRDVIKAATLAEVFPAVRGV